MDMLKFIALNLLFMFISIGFIGNLPEDILTVMLEEAPGLISLIAASLFGIQHAIFIVLKKEFGGKDE